MDAQKDHPSAYFKPISLEPADLIPDYAITFGASIIAMQKTPLLQFDLKDGTHVSVYQGDDDNYEFHLTRLNSERHNFIWTGNQIEESYETRFDRWQMEAIDRFREIHQRSH